MPVYTRKQLADRLRTYTRRLGRAPRTTDLIKLGGPGRNTFVRVFGVKSWKDVIKAVGLEEFVAPTKKPWSEFEHRPVTREDVIEAYRHIITTEGLLPTQEENVILYKHRTKLFPSERAVVEAAGFDYDFLRRITDHVIRARMGRKPKIGYYEAVISEYPWLAKYSKEFIESYMGSRPPDEESMIEEEEKMIDKEDNTTEEESMIEEKIIWRLWQNYYKENLYRPPEVGEPHETAIAQAIMISKSPCEALNRIEKLHERFPSSIGANLVEEFKRLWFRTRTDVLKKHQRLEHPGYIQIERPRKSG
ncbi:hypothetical protein CW696_07645 [ANME-2 cluster archaeon]|nr:MAG: hypothetical protein CW696_07645 [ANME-2 cluster archaeon]